MIARSKKPNPYPGPRPFEPEESGIFFGREREVRELVSLMTAHRTVLLYAQSGAGKTSLLNAGVIPLLTRESFEALPVARVRGFELKDIDLKEIPNIYVFNTLVGWAGDNVEPRSLVSTSMEIFLKEREHLTDEQGLPLPRVAIFDQFEELFTSYPGRWEEREDFFRQVAEALEADPLLRVLFVIREDYLASLDSYSHLLHERLRTRYRLERLRADSACQAVQGPLRDTGRKFAEGVALGLVHKLLNIRVENAAGEIVEVPGEYVEPVQLQVVCQSLWLNLPRDVTDITSDHLEEFGDVQEALRRFYEKAIKTAKREKGVSESDLRQWFNQKLITPAGTRGTVFRGKEQTGGIPNLAVDVLEAQHIIRAEIRAGARWYELTHDRLIEPIRKSNAGKQTGSLRLFRRLSMALVVMVVVLGAVQLGLPQKLWKYLYEKMFPMLNVDTTDGGSVRIDPNKANYHHRGTVTLTAVPDPNYVFYRWLGDLSDSNNPTTLVMNSNKTVIANFALKTYSLTVTAVNGSVTKDPNKARYDHGKPVTLEAIPNEGYSLTSWSGDLSGNTNPATLVMDADKSVTANFDQMTYSRKVFSLTATAVVGGSVTKDPDKVVYDDGEMVTLTAISNVGYNFLNWSGDLSDSNNPATLVMDADKLVTANFALKTYSLITTAADGFVTIDPNKANYYHGERVTLTAVPTVGYRFTSWSGDLSDSNNPTTLLMDADKSVTASFALKTYNLTTTTTDGSVTMEANYYHGETVTLEAVPTVGYRFTNWSGDLSGSNNPTTLLMDADKTIKAGFALKNYSLTATAVNGFVTIDPNKAYYHHGETVTLTAVPDPNYVFDHWSGDLSGSKNPTTLLMDENKSVTANFALKTYVLDIPDAVGGSVIKSPDKVRYNHGETVTLTAVPDPNYVFDRWSGDLSGSTNPTTLVMDANKMVNASFALEKYEVETNSIGMKLVYIPAGMFKMGSPSDEKDRFRDEGPQYEVIISEGFWIGRTEVTQHQYKLVTNAQPWSRQKDVHKSPDNPAVYVSWQNAVDFCKKLSQMEGKTYRLPTEAEWEYACRAGTTTEFSFGDSSSSLGDYAWFKDNAFQVGQEYAHPVGQKKPNSWGLYDMHGNVRELCSDWYDEDYYFNSLSVDPKGPSSGKYRCLRGGSWFNSMGRLRCAYRYRCRPKFRNHSIGFRVVRSQ